MQYKDLFKNGSLSFVRDLVSRIVYQGLNFRHSPLLEAVIAGISTLLVLFALYKLC
jgi:hypothetical protein